jgi:ABC-type transport system substrate-binding protein
MRADQRLRVLALVLILVMAGLLGGCGGQAEPAKKAESAKAPEKPPEKMVIRRGGLDPQQLDNQVNTTNYTLHFSRQIFNSLVRINSQTLEIEAELAESWSVSPDRRTYTFKLKPGIKFTNGAPLTAEDVKFTFERILRPETASVTQWVFAENILGGEDLQSGKVKSLDSIKVIDPLTVSITLKYPFTPFLSQIATGYGSIYPREACAAAGKDWAQKPIGTGPFKVAKWERDSILVLEKNPGYFEKGLPIPDAVEYIVMPDRATEELEFESGRMHWMTLPTDRYSRYAESKWKDYIVETKPYDTYYLALNTTWGPLKDVRVRQAISLAIDRERFVKQVMEGHAKVANSFLPPGIPGYDPSLPPLEYNPAKAKKLLADAGYAKGVEIESWQAKEAESTFRWNVALQEMLKEVGINLKIVKTDRAALREITQQGNRPATWGGWWADYIDPHNFHYPWFHSKNTKSVSVNYNNRQVDAMLDEAVGIQDPVKRAAMYTEVEKIAIRRDMVIVPVFHIKNYAVTQPSLKGVIYLPPTALENFIEAKLVK